MSKNIPTDPDPLADKEKSDLLVVGIGASAGGVGALQTFFKNVKPDSGNAYVVILHLSPQFESQLAEVLQTTSSIPVTQVKEHLTKVEPDHVYVIAPNLGLEINDGHLETTDVNNGEGRRRAGRSFFPDTGRVARA